jgi:hypothetical protein
MMIASLKLEQQAFCAARASHGVVSTMSFNFISGNEGSEQLVC